MYRLEKMEIHGFKSFYDRTVIVLPERTTAVVGPNGCGKSNISDAIHWVLGEQKVRTLRGEKMEDVIFNGSEKRKPLGMAEVSLFLRRPAGNGGDPAEMEAAPSVEAGGNGGDPAGVEAAPSVEAGGNGGDPAEVEAAPTVEVGGNGRRPVAIGTGPGGWPEAIRITRRLFRDGQSDYLIDGGRCRLRDVKDLLERLSVGSGASSIIEQGKVEQIVASKPRERRLLIEEAAGIAGYKAKKREATLKLEATEANLARLEDIIGEVRRQINSTKRQAAKARRYQRLMEERRRIERISYHQRARDLDERLGELRADRGGVQDEEAALAARLASAQAAAEKMRAEVEEGDRRLTVARESLHALDLQVDREERGQTASRKQADELTTAAAAGDEEAEQLAARAGETAAEIATTELEAADRGAELRRLATLGEAGDASAREMQAGINELESEIEARRRELFTRLDQVSELRSRLTRLEEDRRRAVAAAERADREIAEATREHEALVGEAGGLDGELSSAAERLSGLDRTRAACAERAAEAREQLGDVERDGERARLECGSLAERLEALQSRDREDSAQGRATRAAGESARGLVADFVRPDRELEAAAEAYLGDLLPAAIVEGIDAARQAVERVEAAGDGRASFLVPSLPQAPDRPLPPELAGDARVRGRLADLLEAHGPAGLAVRGAANGAVVVDDLDAALDLAGAHPERTFLTLSGQLLRPGGLVAAGRPAPSSEGFLALRRRIQEVSGELAAAEARERSANASAESLRASIETDETAGEQSTRERAELDVSVAELRERLRAVVERRERSERYLQVRRDEAERERADHATWTAEIEQVGVELDAAERDRLERDAAIRDGAEELSRRRAGLTAVQEETAELRSRSEGTRTRLEALGVEVVRLGRSAQELRERAERCRDEAVARRARAADLRDLAERARDSLRRNLERRSTEKARVDQEAEALDEQRRGSAGRAEEAREVGATLEEVRGRRVELEVSLSRAESEREFLEQSCRNDLDQSLAEATAALAEGEADTPREEVDEALEQIRARIDAIGPVNVMAVDEFTEVEERYRFLTVQQKDLQDSVRSLRETIGRINRRSRERFQSAFEQIRGHFQETYRLLFGGGRADLHLEEEVTDILESGVEITAQPPGKRLQRIGLLSGGEKALTAIALLFAIFRYRPSPFCVLDEVDAPLDDANIGRYTEMLRRMAHDTQFVVITHSKRTMERADVLYGVTMDEPGVSRLVSVRFAADGRLAAEDGSGEVEVDGPPAATAAPGPALQPDA